MKLIVTVTDGSIDISRDVQCVRDLNIDVAEVPLCHSQDVGEITRALFDADYVIAGSERYDEQTMSALPRLKLIVRNGVGYDNVDLRAAAKLGIAVCNLPGSNAYSVAEHALAMMLCITRHIPAHTAHIKEGRYFGYIADSLTGRVGLIGFGAIAKQLSRLLSIFDVDVYAYDPFVDEQVMAQYGVKKASMEDVISKSDILSLHLPALAESRHMVDARFIEKMKDGAYFINVARGALVDEDALADALLSKKLSGAGLDVFDPEPLRPNSRLKKVDNILLSPHASTANFSCFHKVLSIGAQAVADFHMQKQPFNLLNPEYIKIKRI